MTATAPATTDEVLDIVLAGIEPDPDQPREDVDEDLAPSIDAQGLLQPITVRPHPYSADTHPYMIVDGERRWRAARKLGHTTIRAIVRDEPDEARRIIRQAAFNTGKPLTAMEEARAWKRVQELTGCNIAQLAQSLGRPKSTVSDRIALAEAPEAFRPLFEAGSFTAAAAPIARKFGAVPAKTLEHILSRATESIRWGRSTDEKKPIPIKNIEEELSQQLAWANVHPVPAPLAPFFKGETFDLGEQHMTADAAALARAQEAYNKEQEKLAPKKKEATPSRPVRDPYLDRWQREQSKRRAESVRFGRARLAILEAFAKAMQKAATGISANGKSAIAELVLKKCSGQGAIPDVLKLMPVGGNAESILRHAAFLCVVDVAANSYLREHHMPRLAKAFGVDIKKITDQAAPQKKKAAKKAKKGKR